MLGLRLPELLVILVVVVFVFGTKKLPELGDSLGKGIRAFKKAAEQGFDDDESARTKSNPQGHLTRATATAKPPSQTDDAQNRD